MEEKKVPPGTSISALIMAVPVWGIITAFLLFLSFSVKESVIYGYMAAVALALIFIFSAKRL